MKNFLLIHVSAAGKRNIQDNLEDVVAVFHGSGSTRACEIGKGKDVFKNMMEEPKVGGYNIKYAAVAFADKVTVNFKLLPYSSASQKISQIPYPGGGTNTQAWLF